MSSTEKSTIYLDAKLKRALQMKALETSSTLSQLIENAVRLSLAEDDEDLSTIRARAKERSLSFADVLKSLKHDGKL